MFQWRRLCSRPEKPVVTGPRGSSAGRARVSSWRGPTSRSDGCWVPTYHGYFMTLAAFYLV